MDLQQHLQDVFEDQSLEIGFSARHIESGQNVCWLENRIFPTASIFKVPVMIEVFKQAVEGKFKLSDRLPLKEADKTLTTGILLTLDEGLTPTIKDLVTLMIIVSDNTATTMLMDVIGIDSVNNSMREYGFTTISVTMSVHEMFLHAFHATDEKTITVERLTEIELERQMDYQSLTFSQTPENNVSSAHEMTQLMEGFVTGKWVSRKACDQMLTILKMQQYTGRVPCYLPWNCIANKTGTMRGLRNDSGILIRGPHDHIAFTIFTFNPSPLPLNNSRQLVDQDAEAAQLMAKVGLLLWDNLGI